MEQIVAPAVEVEAPKAPKAPRKPRVQKAPAAPRKTPVEVAMEKLTHRENCVMVTIGGNKVKWTSADGQVFSFTFFDDGVKAGSGTWAEVIGAEMGRYGITARTGAGAVLASLRKKGLLASEADPQHVERHWWSLTALGAKVALAVNEKDWK